MANIDDFKANLIGGGARANQFRVTITPPSGIAIGLDVRRTSFLVKASNLPASELGEIAIPFRGRNIYVTGVTTGDLVEGITFDGYKHLIVLKFDNNGNLQWVRQFNDGAYNEIGFGIASQTDGSLYVTTDLYAVYKFDSEGKVLWRQQLDAVGQAIAIDGNNNVYITGYTGTNLDGNNNAGSYNQYAAATDIFLVKYNYSGSKLWTN